MEVDGPAHSVVRSLANFATEAVEEPPSSAKIRPDLLETLLSMARVLLL